MRLQMHLRRAVVFLWQRVRRLRVCLARFACRAALRRRALLPTCSCRVETFQWLAVLCAWAALATERCHCLARLSRCTPALMESFR